MGVVKSWSQMGTEDRRNRQRGAAHLLQWTAWVGARADDKRAVQDFAGGEHCLLTWTQEGRCLRGNLRSRRSLRRRSDGSFGNSGGSISRLWEWRI